MGAFKPDFHCAVPYVVFKKALVAVCRDLGKNITATRATWELADRGIDVGEQLVATTLPGILHLRRVGRAPSGRQRSRAAVYEWWVGYGTLESQRKPSHRAATEGASQ